MGTRKKEFPPRHMASPLGHSCRFRDARAAAALPPTAAVMLQCRERRDVPIGDMLSTPGHRSGDHLNGTYVPVEEPSTASRADIQRTASLHYPISGREATALEFVAPDRLLDDHHF